MLREAQIYRSQGLVQEALEIYEQLLASARSQGQADTSELEASIRELQADVDQTDQVDEESGPSDLSVVRPGSGKGEGIEEIIAAASAFKELGLLREAAAEYLKLFQFNHAPDQFISPLMECLLESNSPSKALDHVEQAMGQCALNEGSRTDVKYLVAQIMEEREYPDLALELYEAVKKANPARDGLQSRIENLKRGKVYDSRYGYLLEAKIVSTDQLQNALAVSKKTNKSVEYVLAESFGINKREIGSSLSFFYKCPFKSHDPKLPVPVELLPKLKRAFLIQNSWVPLSWDIKGSVVEILIDDPTNLMKTDNIAALIPAKRFSYCVGIKEDIIQVIEHFYSVFEGRQPDLMGEPSESGMDANIDELIAGEFVAEADEREAEGEEISEASSQIVRMVDQIIITAYRKDASDIHIEPSPATKKTGIRFRIDGVCQDFLQVPITAARGLISRLKIMSKLDIAERRLPQDGKIKFKRKGIRPFELRIATLPTAGGYEDAVLRILAESSSMKIDEMGVNERNLSLIKRIIAQPYGLFLVVGPTGSGKTTTLHAAMGHINKPGIKIWTAEDPVEITQLGLRQVEIKPKIGLDFARIMRAFLRADPDVIMIGEMRDHETASTGIEASLTGHLVLSTLHTNSAPETVTRLLDMGLNALNFSDAFLGVLAQRLVRRICKSCRQGYHPSEEEFNEIAGLYGRQAAESSGISYTPSLTLYRPVGCEECYNSGYKGRLGIHELMHGTPELKRLIKKAAPTEEIFAQAARDGMKTLVQDGIHKAFEGLTDIAEIRRVCVS
jgi:type II secretory ATPase GspE/PulE/Tfp pilus assembly ATPase PilB-like protein